jgi:hypothetical protein
MQANISISGTAPLLMANIAAADPRNPIVKEKAKLEKQNKAKARTEERSEQINKLSWFAYLYTRNSRVVMPADNLLATIVEGAKLSKLGMLAKQAAMFTDLDAYPLKYDGPCELEDLYADGRFVDARMGCLRGTSKILVVRPVFPEWGVTFDLTWDDEILDAQQVETVLGDAGRRRGLGTWRPRFGRFNVDRFEVTA